MSGSQATRDKSDEGGNFLVQRLARLIFELNRFWARGDLRSNRSLGNRSFGGLLVDLRLDSHAPLAYFLALGVAAFLIWGPVLGHRGWLPWLIWLATAASIALAAWLVKRRQWPVSLFFIQLFVLSVLCAVLGVFGWKSGSFQEHGSDPYLHAFLIFFPLFVVLPLCFAAAVRGRLVRSDHGQALREGLKLVDLSGAELEEVPKVTSRDFLASIFAAPVRYPLQLLFLPAVVILLLPYYVDPQWPGIAALLVAWVGLGCLSAHSRWTKILPLTERALLVGGQLLVSLLVIALALGRVLEVSYVETVVESDRVRILLYFLLGGYVFFWFYEYWLNRLVNESLVRLFRGGPPPRGSKAGAEISRSRRVQVHGGGRLLVVEEGTAGAGEKLRVFEKKDLLREVLREAPPGSPLLLEDVREIEKGIDSYFGIVNLAWLFLVVVGGCLMLRWQPVPALTAHGPSPVKGHQAVELAPGESLAEDSSLQGEMPDEDGGEGSPSLLFERLFSEQPSAERDKVVLLAASGGGTRAALYTVALLEGLRAEGALDDLILASGVSGGGAALAYFAAHRPALVAPVRADSGAPADAWNRFACTFSYPFIWDVLEGAFEARVVLGHRSGHLLAESFQREFFQDLEVHSDSPSRPRQELGQVEDVGLILNTALAGHLSLTGAETDDFLHRAHAERKQTTNAAGGGRLILTNLTRTKFPSGSFSDEINYAVVNDPSVSLTKAAALNANFPPVFSNAAVDVTHPACESNETPVIFDRYWVTDGGAVENRGSMSLLLALRDRLREMPDTAQLPELHILLADASYQSTGYSEDRGVGVPFGAARKVADQLLGELVDEVREAYRTHNGTLRIYDLSMPEIFRQSGGVGTHWMLPKTVQFKDVPKGSTGEAEEGETETVLLDGDATRHLVRTLFSPSRDSHAASAEGFFSGAETCEDRVSRFLPTWLFVEPRRREAEKWLLPQLESDPALQCWQAFKTCWNGPGSCPEVCGVALSIHEGEMAATDPEDSAAPRG